MHLQESGEMYLETILVLSKKSSAVRSLDVAEYMGFSKPSVSRAVGLLKSGRLCRYRRRRLSAPDRSRREIAEKIYERHTLLTDVLTRLGRRQKCRRRRRLQNRARYQRPIFQSHQTIRAQTYVNRAKKDAGRVLFCRFGLFKRPLVFPAGSSARCKKNPSNTGLFCVDFYP